MFANRFTQEALTMSDTLIEGSMPAVDPDIASGAVDPTKPEQSPQDTKIVTTTGSAVAFDPHKHETNADGTPRLKADGTPRLKRGQAKIKLKLLPSEGSICTPPSPAGSSVPGSVNPSQPSSPVKPAPTPDQIAAAAVKWSVLYWGAMGFAFGDDGKPQGAEAEIVNASLIQTLSTLQTTASMPWWMEVSLALGIPVWSRIQNPEIRAKVYAKRGKGWWGRMLARLFPGDRKPADPGEASQPNHRQTY